MATTCPVETNTIHVVLSNFESYFKIQKDSFKMKQIFSISYLAICILPR